MARKKGRTVKPAKRMRGRSSTSRDRKRQALCPGLRVSGSGKRYTETRRNRSDRGRWL